MQSDLNPLDYYLAQLASGVIVRDAEQLNVIQHLQNIYHQLLQEKQRRQSFRRFISKRKLVKGLYLWGGVGIGKTFLLDCFYNTLPFPEKVRMHFHAFMQEVQQRLKQYQGKKNPLDIIAKEFSEKAMVICFDELYVSDITDAMILARLFKALLAHGVTLIVTSNQKPDDLYLRGLQRQLFLPAIDLLKKHTHVMFLPSIHDYRLHFLTEAGVFYTPHHEIKLNSLFDQLAQSHDQFTEPLEIHGRTIKIRKRAGDIVWFEFNDLVTPPRSQHDFLEIAKQFKIVFLTQIKKISSADKNKIVLFIRLIDVFYDAKVKLVFSSAVAIDEIYTDGIFVKDFLRIKSRLKEMQSARYFES